MAKRRITVDQWVQTVITDTVDGRPCSAVTCLHVKGVGGATEEIVTKALEGPCNVKEIADHLVGRAEGFSQELAGLQTFKLLAFYGTNEPHNPFHFTATDGNVVSRNEAMQSAHEPTPTGLLGQLMKHNEQIVQQNMALTQANMQLAQGVLGMCLGPQGIIARAQTDMIDAIGVVKDATLDMFTQRRQLRLEELESQKSLQTRQAIIDAIPSLVNRWTGHEVFSEKNTRAKLLEKLALKVKPDDLELMVQLGKLSPEEALMLSTEFAAIVAEKTKEHEALKGAPSEEESNLAVTGNGSNGMQG